MAFYYAVQSPTFQPAMRNILSITQTNPIVVTTTFDGNTAGDHDYETGLIVRLNIPVGFGMQQVNNLYGTITVLSSSTFSLPIDGTRFDAFMVPPLNPGLYSTPAQITPIGEVNSQLKQATRNVL